MVGARNRHHRRPLVWLFVVMLRSLLLLSGNNNNNNNNESFVVNGQQQQQEQPSSLVFSFTSDECAENQFIGKNTHNFDTTSSSSTTSPAANSIVVLRRNPNTTLCSPSLGIVSSSLIATSETTSSRSSSSKQEHTQGNNNKNQNNNNNYAVQSYNSFVSSIVQQQQQQQQQQQITSNDVDGISFEIWFKVKTFTTSSIDDVDDDDDSTNHILQPILTIGTGDQEYYNHDDDFFTTSSSFNGGGTSSSFGNFNFCDTNSIDMMFAQRGKYSFELFYRTSDNIFEPCRRYPLHNILLNQAYYHHSINENEEKEEREQERLVHVVASFTNNHQQIFINGHSYPVLNEPFSPKLQHWNVNESKLYVLSYPTILTNDNNDNIQTSSWNQWTSGTLYQLTVHSGILNTTQVTHLLRRGITSKTPPYAVNYTTYVNEDSELIPQSHYSTPEWYLHQQPVSAASVALAKKNANNGHDNDEDVIQKVQLMIHSVDDEVRHFQESLNLTATTTKTTTTNSTNQMLYVYLLDLPSVGCLYRTDNALSIGKNCKDYHDKGRGSGRVGSKKNNANKDGTEDEMLYSVYTTNKYDVDDPPTLIYLPPLNQHSSTSAPHPSSSSSSSSARATAMEDESEDINTLSSFTRLTYCVSEFPILHPRQCPSMGIINIVVVPVNDPPTALPVVEDLVVKEGAGIGIQTQKVFLTGTDVDENDYIQQVQITDLPQNGYLVLSVSNFRTDGLLHGTLLSDLNYTVPVRSSPSSSSDPVYVKYVWDPPITTAVDGDTSSSPIIIVKGKEATDSFRFRVADKNGIWSSEETVQVVIVSSLTASVTEEKVTIQEDYSSLGSMPKMEKPIKWFGNDTSKYQRDIGYFVENVPPIESGLLYYYDIESQEQLQVSPGDILPYVESYPYKEGLALTFVPSENYCTGSSFDTIHNISAAGLPIGFRTVSFARNDHGKSKVVTSVSDLRHQTVFVKCVIDALNMTGPTHYESPIKALTLRIASRDTCLASKLHHDGIDNQTSYFDCSAFNARINGIQVTSQDTDGSVMARVTIITTVGADSAQGYLTLNREFWNKTIPLHGRRTLNKGKVSFLAGPNDVTNILSDLVYQSFQPGNDTIDIIVEYGNCSSLSDRTKELKTADCQILRHTIALIVELDTNKDVMVSQLVSGFPWQVLLCVLGYPAIYYIFVRLHGAAKGSSCGGGSSSSADDVNDDDTLGDTDTPFWVQYYSEKDGKYYYENTVTGETTWQAPVEDLEKIVWWKEENEDDEKSNEDIV